MIDPVSELKVRAERLQKAVARSDTTALARLRALPELRKKPHQDLVAFAKEIRHKHCLAIVARENGFESWSHALAVLTGEASGDFGTLLCPRHFSAHCNVWSSSYEEAKAIRAETGTYLLAYKRHFFIVDRYYLESLGLDPDDEDWERIGRDWVRPNDLSARQRLYAKLLTRS